MDTMAAEMLQQGVDNDGVCAQTRGRRVLLAFSLL
jgi:hypothetical protein